MELQVTVNIDGSRNDVWTVITDIENSPNTISGIEKVEILERPDEGLVGLKWRETRTLFGKTATEVMWITDVTDNENYRTRAESHGAVYTTSLTVSGIDDATRLSMEFSGIPQTFGARVMAAMTGVIFKKATRKALMQDLDDIKAAVEQVASSQS
ncbi:SRPBCC family protein [Gemmatimonadota bacterium]